MKFWKKTARVLLGAQDIAVSQTSLQLQSNFLQRDVHLEIYCPSDAPAAEEFPLLLFNDGQDLPRMNFHTILENALVDRMIPRVLAVGIHTSAGRIREYGTARQADYKGRGDLAGYYARFICEELLPYLQRHYPVTDLPDLRAFAGFSLGGLSAFDIAWAYPQLFGITGVFSGSFWWRSAAVRPEDPDADRIMHQIIRDTASPPSGQRYWFQCGTLDETDDRNNNGVIDAIDDTLDIIRELKSKGISETSIRYLEVEGGRHEPQTWGEAMPDFLKWAFGEKTT